MKKSNKILIMSLIIVLLIILGILFREQIMGIIWDMTWAQGKIREKKVIKLYVENERDFSRIMRMIDIEKDFKNIFVKNDKYIINDEYYSQSEFLTIIGKNKCFKETYKKLKEFNFVGIIKTSNCIKFIYSFLPIYEYSIEYGIVVVKDDNNLNISKIDKLERIIHNTFFYVGINNNAPF